MAMPHRDNMDSPEEDSNSGGGARLRDFCQRTSLHGWSFCFRPEKPFSHTVGWLMVVAAGIAAAAFNLVVNVREFTAATVVFKLESPTHPLDEVIMPSLTFCNLNQLRKSFIFTLRKDPELKKYSFEELHGMIKLMFLDSEGARNLAEREEAILQDVLDSKTFNDLFDELFESGNMNVTTWPVSNIPVSKYQALSGYSVTSETRRHYLRVMMVEIMNQFRDGENVVWIRYPGYGVYYSPGFATDVSESCTWITPFPKKPADPQDLWSVPGGVSNGANNGLQLLLDAETYDYSVSLEGGEGYILSVLHNLDIPILKQTGVKVAAGSMVDVAVTPSLVDTTGVAKRRFTPASRQCYFQDEVNLRHFPQSDSYRYAMSNCLYEATLQKIERLCNCTPRYYVDTAATAGFVACDGVRQHCMDNFMSQIGSERRFDDAGQNRECLAACKDQAFKMLVTAAAYPNVRAFHETAEFCIILEKLKRGCRGDRREALDGAYPDLCTTLEALMEKDIPCPQGYTGGSQAKSAEELIRQVKKEVAQYARENMVLLTVYVRDSYVKKYLTDEDISEINFVGSLGGILGLFMGFSFISAVEVLYYLIFGENSKKREQRENKVIPVGRKIMVGSKTHVNKY